MKSIDYPQTLPWDEKPHTVRYDPRPYYDYIETGTKGHFHGFSYGKGIYVKHNDTIQWIYPPVFRVQKNTDNKTLEIVVLANPLKTALHNIATGNVMRAVDTVISVDDMLASWNDMSAKLARLKMGKQNPFSTKALELLLEDCLLDSRVYEGTDFHVHYDSGKVPTTHRDAVQHWTVQQDIKDMDLAVERSMKLDEFYIMVGYEPFVTPDGFPSLPQLEVPSAPSTESFLPVFPGSIPLWKQLPEQRQPIPGSLPPGTPYQKKLYHPSATFIYHNHLLGGRTTAADSDSTSGFGHFLRETSPSDEQSHISHRPFDLRRASSPSGSVPYKNESNILISDISHDQHSQVGNNNSGFNTSESEIPFHDYGKQRSTSSSANGSSGSIRDRTNPADFWARFTSNGQERSHPLEPLHKAPGRKRSGLKLADKLSKCLKRTYGRLLTAAATDDPRNGLKSFSKIIDGPLDLYHAGSTALKEVMANQSPHTLRQVMSCVILAGCMVDASLSSTAPSWDSESRWFVEGLQGRDGRVERVERDERRQRQSFLNDLPTWSSLLRSQQDIQHFEEIATVLWGWTRPSAEGPTTGNHDDIAWKSVLALDLTELISKTAHNIRLDDLDYQDFEALNIPGGRLDTIHRDKTMNSKNITPIGDDDPGIPPGPPGPPGPPQWMNKFKIRYKDRFKDRERQPYSITKKDLPAPQIVLLLSGAIFAAVCGFLVAWRSGLNARDLSQVVSRTLLECTEGEAEANPTERNCVYAYLYVCLMWSSLIGVPVGSSIESDNHDGRTLDIGTNTSDEGDSNTTTISLELPATSSTSNSSDTSAEDTTAKPSNSSKTQARKRLHRSPPQASNHRPKIHSCRLTCGQKFTTVGNRNKHERKDCPKLGDKGHRAHVHCQFCNKKMTRAHYAENGHRQRCRGRLSV